MEAPALTEPITPWSVDRQYTALVDHLREGGDPGAVRTQAKAQIIEQVKALRPGEEVLSYIANLGVAPGEGLEN